MKQTVRNEILIDDDLWIQFYTVEVPGGGTLYAEWGNGKIEQTNGNAIFDNRYGLNGVYESKGRHNRVRIFTDAPKGITVFGLLAPWLSGFPDWGKVRIDVSRCISLQQLYCAKVLSLDLSQNINLEELKIGHSSLRELNLDNNCRLEVLELFNCKSLRKLDLRACPCLRHLVLYSCPSLDTLMLNEKSELDYVSYNYNTAIAGESEDRLLEIINRNGGSVEKTYLGD